MRWPLGIALLLVACSEKVEALEGEERPDEGAVPGIPESSDPIELEVRTAWSDRPVSGLRVAFVSAATITWTRTEEGRAVSTGPATDVHVFDARRAISVIGAPPRFLVRLPRRETAAEVGFVASGQLTGPAASRDRFVRVTALAADDDLDGWAGGTGDLTTGLPTHLPRWPATRSAVSVRITYAPVASHLVALVYAGEGSLPVGYGALRLSPGTPISGRATWPVVPFSDQAIGSAPFSEWPDWDELETRTLTRLEDGTTLFLPTALRTQAEAEGPCGPGACAVWWQRRRRADLGEQRGVVVETQTSWSARRVLPVPPPALRRGRILRIPERVEETVSDVVLGLGEGTWRVLLLDDRSSVALPQPPDSDPDPLEGGTPRIAERTDLELDRIFVSSGWPLKSAGWSRRRWLP